MSNAAEIYSIPGVMEAFQRRRAMLAANKGSNGGGARHFPKFGERCVWFLKSWEIRPDRNGYYEAKRLGADPKDAKAAITALMQAGKLMGTQYSLTCEEYAPGAPSHGKQFFWQLDMPIPDDKQLAAIAADPKKGFRPGPDQIKALFRTIGPDFVDYKDVGAPDYDETLDLNNELNWVSWLDGLAGQTTDGTPIYISCVPYERERAWSRNGKSGVDRTNCLGQFQEVVAGEATETAPVVEAPAKKGRAVVGAK